MKKLVIFIFLFFNHSLFSQGIEGPMEASPENKPLIIELMVESKFEAYFTDYCSKRMDFLGKEKGLTKEKIAEYKKKVSFAEFLDYTVFNQFAEYSSEELKQMITLCKTLNKGKKFNWVFISTPIIESNLELFIRQYMKD
ncbi:MAG: hypothetical protein ACO1N0_20710 [Fluviicola sp.]